VEGVPELIGEVAASSVSFDLHLKKDTYAQTGAREYIVWRVYEQALDWFVRRGRQFVPLKPDAEGVYRSKVFPGLWLDVAALIRQDMATVARVAQQGLGTPEHAAFVERLRRAARPRAR
jgi:hypothetical protein